ncbi:alpha/beta hydrolase family esterase [Corynebacterium mayonis]|uniref:alpha/beta hydrolase family esterase n=1 Tax=Corynebacterium mayonis TaxID=3062461 RepID=UPI0031406AD9
MNVQRRLMMWDKRERTWLEVAGGKSDTLVVFLHGSRQSSNVARAFTGGTFDELARRGCTVLYPDGVGHHFNDLRRDFAESARLLQVDDVGFIGALIESYSPRRVIGCGFSNGGQMLMRMLFDAPGTFHGAALFGAPMPTAGNCLSDTSDYLPVPVLTVHGTADPIVPFAGGIAGGSVAHRGEVRSARASAEFFAALNGCTEHRRGPDGEVVAVDRWTGGEADVKLVSLRGVGHLVPSPQKLHPRIGPGTNKVVGAQLVADFFDL